MAQVIIPNSTRVSTHRSWAVVLSCCLQLLPKEWSDPAAAYERTKSAVQASLQQLGLEYIDLMLLHAPGQSEGRADAWRALEEAHKQVRR